MVMSLWRQRVKCHSLKWGVWVSGWNGWACLSTNWIFRGGCSGNIGMCNWGVSLEQKWNWDVPKTPQISSGRSRATLSLLSAYVLLHMTSTSSTSEGSHVVGCQITGSMSSPSFSLPRDLPSRFFVFLFMQMKSSQVSILANSIYIHLGIPYPFLKPI